MELQSWQNVLEHLRLNLTQFETHGVFTFPDASFATVVCIISLLCVYYVLFMCSQNRCMLLLCIPNLIIFCNFNEKCKNEVTLPNTLKMILDLTGQYSFFYINYNFIYCAFIFFYLSLFISLCN